MSQQSTTSGTSSRRHQNVRDHDTASITSSRIADINEWEANEALRQRELEEARGRAAQMEKTMRWWSDCTANWREKWSKVRNERNKAREECKQLRSRLDTSNKDCSVHRREKDDLEIQNEQLKKEMEKIHILLLKHAGQFDSQIFEALGEDPLKDFIFSSGSGCNSKNGSPGRGGGDFLAQGQVTREEALSPRFGHGHVGDLLLEEEQRQQQEDDGKIGGHKEEYDHQEYVIQKMSMLQLRLDEATKTLQIEREEKCQLHRLIDKLTVDLQEIKEKCDELKEAKQDSTRELLTLQDLHREEVKMIKADLQDEACSREGMDKRLNDLRTELERLQAENAAEWGKRERLETEKLALERDNKKLRGELRDMQERVERKGRPLSNADAEVRHLQQELSDKTKEITELRHAQAKQKKVLQDKMTELAHAVRRAEQYESEVKKLRARVEELKRDLAIAEDDLDNSANNIRKLQRSNDELQEQVDNFQVQLQHLHTRLRNCSSSSLLSHRGTLLAEDGSDEDAAEY